MPFYHPPREIEEKMDSAVETTVPVIASFNIQGGIRPLYFRYQDQDITIRHVQYCRPYPRKTVFKCTAQLDDYLREIQITYWIHEQLWTLLV